MAPVKAIVYRHYGGPERLETAEVSVPKPRRGELLVRVRAAALNPIDWKIMRGDFRWVTGGRMPRGIGMDFAGTVEAAGGGVDGFSSGQRVLGIITSVRSGNGSLAEFVCARASDIAPMPDALSFETAASLPGAGVSALACLQAGGPRRPGSAFLIVGATGGVGSFCVQLAKLRDLRVTAVCREENAALARELGADAVIAYDRSDPLRSGDRFDVILDVAAQYSFARCAHLLASRGTYVTTIPGPKPVWDWLRTAFLGTRRARFIFARPSAGPIGEIARLAADGKLRPLIGRTFPLAAAQAAYAELMTGHTRGKIVVTVPA